MSPSVSLRRSLRAIPVFQSLRTWELDQIAACMVRKTYQAGDQLWRAGAPLDFVGIVGTGELLLEYQANDSDKRIVRLGAGAFFQPAVLKTPPPSPLPAHGEGGQPPSASGVDRCQGAAGLGTCGSEAKLIEGGTSFPAPTAAYAADEALTLYVLRLEQLDALRARCPALDATLASAQPARVRRLAWETVWRVAVAMLIVLLTWRDVRAILSGVLGLAAEGRSPWQALTLLSYATWLDPYAIYAYNEEGAIWHQAGKWRQASAAFEHALTVDSSYGPALNNLAAIRATGDGEEQSVTLQQRAARAAPNSATVHYNLGLMLVGQRDYVEAIRAFKEATRIAQDWAAPYLQLSLAYLRSGEANKAEEAARIAVRLAPDQQPAYLSLAIALYKQHQAQDALTAVERAVAMDPDDVVARFYQALILSDMGSYEQALQILHETLEQSGLAEEQARIGAEIERLHRLSNDK